MQSMENDAQLNEQLALVKEYSSLDSSPDCPLPNFKLEDDLIFACCQVQEVHPTKSLQESQGALEYTIKNFMKMRITCKKYYETLTFEKIGNYCKNHSCFARNQIVRDSIVEPKKYSLISKDYHFYRSPLLILIHAVANIKNNIFLTNANETSLLERANKAFLQSAINQNDTYMLKTLFKYQMIDPDAKEGDKIGAIPLFFCAKTVEMAQIFIDNGTNIHATPGNPTYNVLTYIKHSHYKYPPEIRELYLQRGVKELELR